MKKRAIQGVILAIFCIVLIVLCKKIPDGTVPTSLLNFLEESFFTGNAAEILTSMVSGQLLPEEEVWKFADSQDIKECLEYIEEFNVPAIYLYIDADNDGISDLFFWIDDGGSSGNTTWYLFKGQDNGRFIPTENAGVMVTELTFINYCGENYLLETELEYNRNTVNVFCVAAFKDGKKSDMVFLEAKSNGFEPKIVSCKTGYDRLAQKWAERGKDGFKGETDYDWCTIVGNAEIEETDEKILKNYQTIEESHWRDLGYTVYRADIDNDGIDERYWKTIFYPSSMYVPAYMENDLYVEEKTEQVCYLPEYYQLTYEGTPLMFWVETVELEEATRQIICLFTYEGLDKNYLYGYLIEDSNVENVFEIDYTGNLEMERQREESIKWWN